MQAAESIIRFSLDSVPERDRLATLTEVFGRGVTNMEFTPLDDQPRFEFEIQLLPGVAVTRGFNSPHISNSGRDPSRRSDDLMLAWSLRPAQGRMLHRGKEISGDGTGAFVTCAEQMIGETYAPFDFYNVRISRHLLAQLMPDPEDRLMRPVPAESEALRLLDAYLGILRKQGEPACPKVAHAVALHIADLVALAIGTERDETELASTRGLRAARACAVKKWLLERLSDPTLSLTMTAAAHGISPRYVQMLFEMEGTSFTCWLRSERLALAHRWLASPEHVSRSISSIAFDCGFSDLSWFNHAYRRTYGEKPSDTRHRSLAEDEF